ncbi:MAG: phosphatidylglycerophosphatase A [Magnetococcales bacterium]|nr:phosphatidylglycerophosphatase A [Magnetococcales bacterium]
MEGRWLSKLGLDQITLQVATLGGIGQSPVAPGTMGTMASLPLVYLVMQGGLAWHLWVLGGVVVIGTWAAHRAAFLLGRDDPSEVVVDELAGMLLTMVGLPLDWVWLFVGFCAFRLFDIWKPWPVSWIDRTLPGGWGIMADDLAAGVYARLLVTVLIVWMESG